MKLLEIRHYGKRFHYAKRYKVVVHNIVEDGDIDGSQEERYVLGYVNSSKEFKRMVEEHYGESLASMAATMKAQSQNPRSAYNNKMHVTDDEIAFEWDDGQEETFKMIPNDGIDDDQTNN